MDHLKRQVKRYVPICSLCCHVSKYYPYSTCVLLLYLCFFHLSLQKSQQGKRNWPRWPPNVAHRCKAGPCTKTVNCCRKSRPRWKLASRINLSRPLSCRITIETLFVAHGSAGTDRDPVVFSSTLLIRPPLTLYSFRRWSPDLTDVLKIIHQLKDDTVQDTEGIHVPS
jgi:hypothetical protein